MKQKMFLTSALAMGFVAPAMAITDSNSFPDASQGEYMQVDTRYINAATSTNMAGVYEGTVDAVAQYTDVLYQIAAGEYLPADSETVINCDQPGYFCPGVSGDVYYDEDNAQGLTSCSTVGDGSYTSSDGTGSTSDTCYRQCSGNVTIEHATGVTGNDYYGNGIDTCAPTGCDNGYHVKDAITDLKTFIGSTSPVGIAYVHVNSNGNRENMGNTSAYGLSNVGDWATDFGDKGVVYGVGKCLASGGTAGETISTSMPSEGSNWQNRKYCWCNINGYKPKDGIKQSISSGWVYYDYSSSSDWCNSGCSRDCQSSLFNGLKYSNTILDSVTGFPTSPAMCEANTITINWNGTTQAAINANNAGTATYDGDIRTPQSASHVPGKTFTGWRFVAPEQTNLPD